MDAFSLFCLNFAIPVGSLNLGFCVCAMAESSCLVIASKPLQALLSLSPTWQSVCYVWLKSEQIHWKVLTKHLEPLYNNMES